MGGLHFSNGIFYLGFSIFCFLTVTQFFFMNFSFYLVRSPYLGPAVCSCLDQRRPCSPSPRILFRGCRKVLGAAPLIDRASDSLSIQLEQRGSVSLLPPFTRFPRYHTHVQGTRSTPFQPHLWLCLFPYTCVALLFGSTACPCPPPVGFMKAETTSVLFSVVSPAPSISDHCASANE